jgi:hypothetical protein
MVAAKTDGVRVALAMTRGAPTSTDTNRQHECAFLIDRTNKMYSFPCSAEVCLFNGSLFDMELVWSEASNCFVLLAFDVAVIEGDNNVENDPLSSRLRTLAAVFPDDLQIAIRGALPEGPDATGVGKDADGARTHLIASGFVVSELPGVSIAAKQMRRLQVGGREDGAPRPVPGESALPCDGYVLTPDRDSAPRPGTAWSVFKVKASHTIDLLWAEGKLWFGDGDSLFDIATLVSNALAITWQAPPSGIPPQSVVEMAPTITSADDGSEASQLHLAFVSIRQDRDVPNNHICILGSINSVRDGITLATIEA